MLKYFLMDKVQILAVLKKTFQPKIFLQRCITCKFLCVVVRNCSVSHRIKNLKNTPIYVRPQFSSGGGVVTVTVMVGIRANVGKPVDNITLQLVLPPSVASSDLTANHGSVLPNHSTRVLFT